MERTLPEVVVLAPDEVPDALGWPEFDPGPLTAAGTVACGQLSPAGSAGARPGPASAAARRTSCAGARCGRPCAPPGARTPTGSPSWPGGRPGTTRPAPAYRPGGRAAVLELADRFGDDGLVGLAAVSEPDGPQWTADLVAVSCRAGGRGAVPVLLTGLARCARAAGAGRLAVPCRLTERNVPIRLGLRQAGFAAVRAGRRHRGLRPRPRRRAGVPGLGHRRRPAGAG